MTELNVANVLLYYGATKVPTGVGWHSMNCPFHGDEHASGRVSVDANAYKCHGCGMSGTALKLIEMKEQLDEEAACEFSRSVLGQSVTDISQSAKSTKKRRPLGRERFKNILE